MIFCYDRAEQLVCILDNTKPDTCPYDRASFHEVLNGEFTLEFTVPFTHPDAALIPEDGYCIVEDLNGNYQLFCITRFEDHHGTTATRAVFAEQAQIELLDDVIESMTLAAGTDVRGAITAILNGTRWSVGNIDDDTAITTPFVLTNVDKKEAIRLMRGRWRGDLTFRTEIYGTTFNRYLDMAQEKGVYTGRRFEYGRDLLEVTRQIDTSQLKTALIGIGGKPEGSDRESDFTAIAWVAADGDPIDKPAGRNYIANEAARLTYGRIGADGTRRHLWGFHISQESDPEALLQDTWTQLAALSTPLITYEVKVVDLSELTESDTQLLRIGDTMNIIDRDLGISLEARVLERIIDLNEREKSTVIFGQYQQSLTRTVAETIPGYLREGEPVRTKYLQGVITALQNRIEAGGGTVQITENDGILITDPTNPDRALKLEGGILAIANTRTNGVYDWRTFGTGDGFVADLITAGSLSFDRSAGGTLTLGGPGNGNGRMQVLNEAGLVIADLDAAQGGFSDLYVGQLSANNAVLKNFDNIVYLVDPINGNDENDGLSNATAFKRMQTALNQIPKYNTGDVQIYVIGSPTMNEAAINIFGFFGEGRLVVDFGTATVNGMLYIKNCNMRIEVNNGTFNQVYGTEYVGDGTLSARHSKYVLFTNNKVYSRNNVDYCILAKDSTVIVNGGEFYDGTTASIEAEYAANVSVIGNCKGMSRAGIRVIGTAKMAVHNVTCPAGRIPTGYTNPLNQELAYGGVVVGTVSAYDAGAAYQPPAPPSTSQWGKKKTGTWNEERNSNGGWVPDNFTMLQGEWDGYGLNKGCFWFTDSAKAALAGKTIISGRIKLWRYNGSGWSASYPISLYTLNQGSEIFGNSEPSPQFKIGNYGFKWGESKWIDIPNWIIESLRDGVTKGFCIYTSERDKNSYIRMDDNALLEVTYQ